MDVQDLITPESVVDGLSAGDKKSLLKEIADKAATVTGMDVHEIFELMLEREKLASTGFGNGVAIPHVRSGKLNGIYGFFFRLKNPVNFESVDGEPVDLVFFLLTPEESGADHLRALSRVSRTLKHRSLCEKIRHCTNADGIYALLTDVPESYAA